MIVKNINKDQYSILCVDDSMSQLEKYRFELDDLYKIYLAKNYNEASEILKVNTPDLIILDINMPVVDGFQFIDKLNLNKLILSNVSILMVSSDGGINTIQKAFEHGVSDYIKKPYSLIELKLRIQNQINQIIKVREYELSKLKMESFKVQTEFDLKDAKDSIVFTLTELAKTRDNETGTHLQRIKRYTLILIEKLLKLPQYNIILTDDFIDTVYNMSALHDIGKVGISDCILKKEGLLTPDEFKIMKTHTNIGGIILKRAYEQYPKYNFLKVGMNIAMYHHEKWDGTGYPAGLAGNDIPIEARIVSIADVYDALITKRVYKEEYTLEQTLSIMKSENEKAFDPLLLEIFFDLKDDFYQIKKDLN